MIDRLAIQQAVHIVTDEQGVPVVQIPLPLWEKLLNALAEERPQHEQIKALLAAWDAEPDDTPVEWWDEFDAFMAENRFELQDRDLGAGDR
jgi:hypothetical protein